jgi:hypothetical protein
LLAKPVGAVCRGLGRPSRRLAVDAEILATAALLSSALVIGLATVGDYGMSVDEFNADDYGPKALAWYTSGFTDRSTFSSVEDTLWYYGPWFHILITLVQSLRFADPWTVRHAMTFLAGLAGLLALLPIGRLAVGRWAGLVAIGLCLTTGYLYGSIFVTPIDVPFLFAMTWATLSIIVMAGRVVPSWPATIGAGLLTGLAIATRSSGIITQSYLLGATVLCALEAIVRPGGCVREDLLRIGTRTACALAIAWIAAFAIWPWLQVGNPFSQFKAAFLLFANHPNSFEILSWGEKVLTTALPWSYVPGQLAARLPEAFLGLLLIGIGFALAGTFGFVRATYAALARRRTARLRALALVLARSRRQLIVWAAAILPIGFIIVRHSTLYDGIRHVLFVIPILAVIAGIGLLRLLPFLRRLPVAAAVIGGAYVGVSIWTLAILHPLEYVATNVLTAGVKGAYERFDLDYWSLAAAVALRRLESRLDYDLPQRFADNPPSIMICIGYRESKVAPMFRRPWRLEVDAGKADFFIATERWRCERDVDEDVPVVLIDEVKRFDRAFAWTYARQPGKATAPAQASMPH